MEQRNLLIALVLSIAVIVGWGMIFPEPRQNVRQVDDAASRDVASAPEETLPADRSGSANAPQSPPTERVPAAGGEDEIFTLSGDVLEIDVDTRGRVVSAKLPNYRESLERGSDEPVTVLFRGEPNAMYVNAGVIGSDVSPTFRLVSREADGSETSMLLAADLGDGRVWERRLILTPGSYAVKLEDRIRGGAGTTLYQQVVERYPDKEAATLYEHAGPVGLINDELVEIGYEDLDEKGADRRAAIGGWTGIMDRYFIAAIIPDQEQDHRYYYKGDGRAYQAGLIDDGVANGDDAVFRSRLYIGPKSIPVMKRLGVGLERSADFGWFAFIAKPLHDLLLWLHGFVPNYGWCIILLVVLIKIIFYLPSKKSYESMAAMRKLQPEMERLRSLHGDDRQRLGQEMMELYKKHKVNPLGGCLPIIIQIPVFFALYKVLLISIEMRHAPFIGWIDDLSAQDPYFILPVLMGLSMFVQQRLNPQPPDPMQAKVMQFLPFIFTGLFLFFPSGLVLYWVVNNVLSIAQQRYVIHQMEKA